MFSWRLLLAQGLPRYADLIERTLYNVVATSPSHEGTAFYYTNTLHQRVPGHGPADGRRRARARRRRCARRGSPCRAARRTSPARWPAWRRTSRPPTTTACSSTSTRRPASARRWPTAAASELDVETDYPRDGVVRVTVATTEDRPWTLTLRVPLVGGGRDAAHPGRRAAGRRRARSRCTGGSPRATSSSCTCRWRRGCRAPTRASTRSAAASWSSAVRRCSALESVDLGGADVSRTCAWTWTPGCGRSTGACWPPSSPAAPADDAWPYGSAPATGGPAPLGGPADRVPRLGEPGTVDDAGVAAAGVSHPTG